MRHIIKIIFNTFIRVICPNRRKIPITANCKGDAIKRVIAAVTATVTTKRIFIL